MVKCVLRKNLFYKLSLNVRKYRNFKTFKF